MATSRTRHRVWPMQSDTRNSSADENARAAKPNCFSRSGRDSRMDASSSTTVTSMRSMAFLSQLLHESQCSSPGEGVHCPLVSVCRDVRIGAVFTAHREWLRRSPECCACRRRGLNPRTSEEWRTKMRLLDHHSVSPTDGRGVSR
jgi:hypothetical protein